LYSPFDSVLITKVKFTPSVVRFARHPVVSGRGCQLETGRMLLKCHFYAWSATHKTNAGKAVNLDDIFTKQKV